MIEQQLIPLTTGERLRQEREKRGLDLTEVAVKLRIDLPVMNAVEQDKLAHLALVYQRGYIRTYAQFLNFKNDDIEQMLEAIGHEHPEIHTVFPEAGNPNQADRWIKATSYVLASLLVGTLAWQFTHEAVRLSQSGASPLAASDGLQDGRPGTLLDPASNQINSATHVNASIAAIEILQQQRSARKNGSELAWAALQPDTIENVATNSLAPGEFALELTASGDSWVEISDATGKKLEVDIVRGGSTKHYIGVAPFDIQFGRASALNLYLDGQLVDLAPFTAGDVTRMKLDGSKRGSETTKNTSGEG
ncbi:MAG: cytoskeleton protein RodZ [Lysobacterales bacterium]|jgi:cytoskeleton protein RodZ